MIHVRPRQIRVPIKPHAAIGAHPAVTFAKPDNLPTWRLKLHVAFEAHPFHLPAEEFRDPTTPTVAPFEKGWVFDQRIDDARDAMGELVYRHGLLLAVVTRAIVSGW